LVDIIFSCSLGGRCDKQSHFVTGLRSMRVMAALNPFFAAYRESGKAVLAIDGNGTPSMPFAGSSGPRPHLRKIQRIREMAALTTIMVVMGR